MSDRLNISSFLSPVQGQLLIDVRAPIEYSKGHIPGAVNIPLFRDDERAAVGTTFKQNGQRAAIKQGLDYIGPRMSDIIEEVEKHKIKSVNVYCWRGGRRSAAVAWLLGFYGFEVKLLSEGYKAFRRFVQNYFVLGNWNFIMLGGKTGTGKTHLLHALEECGEQILDLEGLANHKGSAFGDLGEQTQPSVEHFENLLYDQLVKLDPNKRIWVENESKAIGRVYIPDELWAKLKESPLININVSDEEQLRNLVNDYAEFEPEMLINCFDKIKKRLGGLNFKVASENILSGDYASAAEIALLYYNKTYLHCLENNSSPEIVQKFFSGTSYSDRAIELIELADSRAY